MNAHSESTEKNRARWHVLNSPYERYIPKCNVYRCGNAVEWIPADQMRVSFQAFRTFQVENFKLTI